MSNIQLFSYPTSPYGQKVGCYLKFKQLEFKFIGVNPMTNAQIRFTRQRQVPVLQIADEWRKESTDLGLWLDQRYSENPMLPSDELRREKILAIDKWVSDSLIRGMFRGAMDWQNSVNSITNGWKLARAVNNATPLPLYAQMLWPFGVKRVPFIVEMVEQLDLSESMSDMMQRLEDEFIKHLGGADYLAGENQPTLADLSAFPIIVNAYMMGMRSNHFLLNNPIIRAWAKRVASHLPDNPLLIPDSLIKRRL